MTQFSSRGYLYAPKKNVRAHVQEDEDHHHGRAPLVHAAHELAEEHVVGDVADRLVGAASATGRSTSPGTRR